MILHIFLEPHCVLSRSICACWSSQSNVEVKSADLELHCPALNPALPLDNWVTSGILLDLSGFSSIVNRDVEKIK